MRISDWSSDVCSSDLLLPHEYTHSWDGKFRRPAELWTPNYSVPMRDSGLWVYEGQTQFWGYVLQARSGLVSKEDTLDARSEEHTSELQSLMRISYAVFCLQNKMKQ